MKVGIESARDWDKVAITTTQNSKNRTDQSGKPDQLMTLDYSKRLEILRQLTKHVKLTTDKFWEFYDMIWYC